MKNSEYFVLFASLLRLKFIHTPKIELPQARVTEQDLHQLRQKYQAALQADKILHHTPIIAACTEEQEEKRATTKQGTGC